LHWLIFQAFLKGTKLRAEVAVKEMTVGDRPTETKDWQSAKEFNLSEELSRFRSSEEKGKGRGKAKTKLAKKFAIAGPKTMAHVQALPLAVIANARSSACTGACCAFHQGTTTCSALRSDISCAGKPRASSLRE
jgi:hypothetical protein